MDAGINLSTLVRRGQRVVIKPNLVFDGHPLGAEGTACTITSADVVRQIIQLVLAATNGDVDITVCDVPLQSARWDALMSLGGYNKLMRDFPRIPVLDFRRDIAVRDERGIVTHHIQQRGDPRGYVAVDLAARSALAPIEQHADRLRITDYGRNAVSPHHHGGRHEYLVSRSVMEADLIINVPKLKTHAKAGMTCAMKNLVGINGDKSWIAHHRAGCVEAGGDEYPQFRPFAWAAWHVWDRLKRNTNLAPLVGRMIPKGRGEGGCMEGSWHGNDTIWRCVADLNEIVLMCDRDGVQRGSQQRNYLAVVDALIAGEGAGPMQCTPVALNTILVGENPWCVDYTACALMGWDWKRIKTLHATQKFGFQYAQSHPPHKHTDDRGQFVPPKNWQCVTQASNNEGGQS